MKSIWQRNILELIRRTSSDLPHDVTAALEKVRRKESASSPARWALDTILENVCLARERGAPLCQDTGTLLFDCRVPVGFDTLALSGAIRCAVRQATRLGYLRQNTIDTLTDKACAGNIGLGTPAIHLEYVRGSRVDIRLIMKGGGSENMSIQYSLPDSRLKAGRDWDGVCRCVLDAVRRAQGNGCAPGVLGIGVGGDRATGAELAKRQLLRRLSDHAADPGLARLEKQILAAANKSGIGPMGCGGRTTLLGVKIGAMSRLPASYFVSVSYMCWAFRRRGVALGTDGCIRRWMY
ncbi:MAG: fumarate hydratase [Verrucomicrobia bacterium]|nr:fumarate hydratase [Verrucomicrobiota bacterium]MCG2680530.1 fumarate hydratase [Kiritimatiellia bacterium]MBU4247920.1 fumarate hydratase [Verrucomicrobiota bacterium]MBU4289519.1 fumarate hydratase [Verrucomicrobiota bacterium]MBU4428383.1 fumarate hydratase [Verrucomicrobiota bacterium]